MLREHVAPLRRHLVRWFHGGLLGFSCSEFSFPEAISWSASITCVVQISHCKFHSNFQEIIGLWAGSLFLFPLFASLWRKCSSPWQGLEPHLPCLLCLAVNGPFFTHAKRPIWFTLNDHKGTEQPCCKYVPPPSLWAAPLCSDYDTGHQGQQNSFPWMCFLFLMYTTLGQM